MNRRDRKKQETREALLHAAMNLIKERGIYETRIEDITEKCDVGKGVFYNYFDSKNSIIAELLDNGVRILKDEYLLVPADSPELATRIAGIALQHERFFSEHPEYSLLFHQTRGMILLNKAAEPRIQKAFMDYLSLIARRISPPSNAGSTDALLLDAAAALAGAVTGNHTFRQAAGLQPDASIVIRMVSEGLKRILEDVRKGQDSADKARG